MSGVGAAARLAAISAVMALVEGRCERLDAWPFAALAPRDRALARELAWGAIAHQRLYDWLIDRCLPRPETVPVLARQALRIVAHQLFALDRIPVHAALSSTVAAMRNAEARGLCGIVNAVGRRLAQLRQPRHGDGPLGRLACTDWPADLAIRYSLPELLLRDLETWHGPLPEDRLAALAYRPPLCTRTRPGHPSPVGRSVLRREGPWTWWEEPEEALQGPVSEGRCVVQDRCQGRIVDAVLRVAKARPGALVLDLCAAPGGKALALQDAGLRVVAADLSWARLQRVPSDIPRAVCDGRQAAFAAAFDVVLVDAPCTNSGVFGRRPEARLRYTGAQRDALVALQRALLASAAACVAADGCLIYATCSVSPCENQGVAHTLAGWRVLGECLTWPDRWQGGGYWAVLVRC